MNKPEKKEKIGKGYQPLVEGFNEGYEVMEAYHKETISQKDEQIKELVEVLKLENLLPLISDWITKENVNWTIKNDSQIELAEAIANTIEGKAKQILEKYKGV